MTNHKVFAVVDTNSINAIEEEWVVNNHMK